MISILGYKIGMTQIFTTENKTQAVTLIKLGTCIITQINLKNNIKYNTIQIGFDFCKKKKLNNSINGFLKKKNLISIKLLKEYSIEKTLNFSLGQILDTQLFNEKEFISIRGKSIGKGFSGVGKRYNFVRGPLSHGSKNHRQPGAIGQGTTPGRVFKGKKLAGNTGNYKKTSQNLQILKINHKENLLILKGNLVGNLSNYLSIQSINTKLYNKI